MAPTKQELLRRGVSDQEALVKAMQTQVKKPKQFVIPAGRKLLEQVDKTNMAEAVFNWLRHTRAFSEVTISFAKDPSKFRRRSYKVFDFNPHDILYWEHRDHGKQALAERIAEIINTRQFVTLTARADGIWIEIDEDDTFRPTNEDGTPSEDWEPYVEFLPKGVSEYGR